MSESVFPGRMEDDRESAASTRKIPHSPLALELTRVVRDGASHREAAVGTNRLALYRCRRSGDKPYCDGSHAA